MALWFVLSRLGGGDARSTWDSQAALHRPRIVEADEGQFVMSDAVDRLEHRWEAFTHVRETAGLFLLYTSPYAFYFIPKRAFAHAADLHAFRELLRHSVAERPAPAFAVLPAAAPGANPGRHPPAG